MAPYATLHLNVDHDGYVVQGTLVLYDEDGGSRKTSKVKLPDRTPLDQALDRLGVEAVDDQGRLIVPGDVP